MKSDAPLSWRAFIALIRRVPQAPLSRAVGWLADRRLPRFLRRPVFVAFSRLVGIDLAEVELPIVEYESLGAFFVRRLRPGLRPMPDDSAVIVSPVDGRLAAFGKIDDGLLVQVKGIRYSAADLLDDPAEAARFDGGSFITIYLSPKDYHRIHTPIAGCLDWARHIPGAVFPVNRPAVHLVPNLFARNERLACLMKGSSGRLAIVAVAAINVARISSAFDPSWNSPGGGVTNHRGAVPATRRYEPAVEMARGEDLMAFHLGSTIVMLLEKGCFKLRPGLDSGEAVRVGEPLADLVP